MRYLSTLFLSLICSFLHADWHSWDNPPQDGQLYMYFSFNSLASINETQTINVTHFNQKIPKLNWEDTGWWDFNYELVSSWLQKGYKIIYGID